MPGIVLEAGESKKEYDGDFSGKQSPQPCMEKEIPTRPFTGEQREKKVKKAQACVLGQLNLRGFVAVVVVFILIRSRKIVQIPHPTASNISRPVVFIWGRLLLPKGHLPMSRNTLIVTTGSVLLDSIKQRPQRLRKTLQCTGQPCTAKKYPAPNVSSAGIENPRSRVNEEAPGE